MIISQQLKKISSLKFANSILIKITIDTVLYGLNDFSVLIEVHHNFHVSRIKIYSYLLHKMHWKITKNILYFFVSKLCSILPTAQITLLY